MSINSALLLLKINLNLSKCPKLKIGGSHKNEVL